MMRTNTRLLVVLAIGFFAFSVPAAVIAENETLRYGYGKIHAGFQVGYGDGFSLGNSGTGDTKNVRYISVFPSLAIGISDPLGYGAWYEGNFDFVAEPEFFAFLGSDGGYSVGLGVLLRYNFLSAGKIVPYLELGLGAGYINSDLRDQANGVAFYPQGGLGVDILVFDDWALNLSYRVHHISNGSTRNPNNGINTNLGMIGMKYYFD